LPNAWRLAIQQQIAGEFMARAAAAGFLASRQYEFTLKLSSCRNLIRPIIRFHKAEFKFN